MPEHNLSPDTAQIEAHLRHLTRRWHELGQPVMLEVVHLSPDDKAVVKDVARFSPDETGLSLAVAHIAAMNAYKVNSYVVVNPVDATRPLTRGSRASTEDIVGSFFQFADGDTQQAADNIRNFVGPKCTFVVITGTVPHVRPHVYWELEEPTRNLSAWSRIQASIAATLATDKVIDAPRIMRVAGTINWPKPSKQAKGYVVELTTIHIHDPDERPPVTSEQMDRAFQGRPAAATTGLQIDTGDAYGPALDRALAVANIKADANWRNNVKALVASYVARGWTDEEILDRCAAFTLPGYTEADTRQDVASFISWTREQEARNGGKYATSPTGQGAEAKPAEPPQITRASTFRCAAEFQGVPVPERRWLVPDLIPQKVVTSLYGDGGTGKSLLAKQLAIAVATGGRWLGRSVASGPVVFLSAEDDEDEIHRRFAAIVESEGLAFTDLGSLTFRSLAGEDALLAKIDGGRSGVLSPSALHGEVDAVLSEKKPALVVLDTLADLFPGNENDRAQVTQFVGILIGLAIRHDCAVLLLAHPSRSGMASGGGDGGSTAWNGKVRSRLYLERVLIEGEEPDTNARIMTNKKANLGPTGIEISMKWKDGVFIADEAETGLDRMAAGMKAERVFLKLLRLMNGQRRYVSPNPSISYAPSVFSKHPDSEGVSKRAFVNAMEILLANGKVTIGTHGRGSDSKQHLEEGRG